MNPPTARSYRWLLWTLALAGCLVDQAAKYGVFKALYAEALAGPPNHHGFYEAERTLLPGAFKVLVQFTGERAPEGVFTPLRTWSGPVQPHVNDGALVGMGGGNE